MKIQTRLGIFSSDFWDCFALRSVLVYGLYTRGMERSIYANLENIAQITAFFFLEEDACQAGLSACWLRSLPGWPFAFNKNI